ncbi:transcriptional regulator [Sphingobium tyrosinilyticum]|uniref:Transcriptional regulator n=1 Tax=Sphingobium tyrosinilyticum TaxID=2715436 RepID=A0ABV9EY39_9SPHN
MSEQASPFEALKAAVHRAGSQSALARICGVSQTAVWKWLQSGKRLPAEFVLKVEAETTVSRYLLRPDIYPVSLTPTPGEAGEECGAILSTPSQAVACDRKAKTQRKDVA